MVGTAITLSLLIGFTLGFISYWACRVGYKELMRVLEEEKNAKKIPLACSDQLD